MSDECRSAKPSITAELNALLADTPSVHAAAAVRATWFRRKAALWWRIAAETDIPAEATEAVALAVLAERRAEQIQTT